MTRRFVTCRMAALAILFAAPAFAQSPAGAQGAMLKRPQEAAILSGATGFSGTQVTFPSKASGVVLAGSFSTPAGSGPFPTVVIISGLSPNGRDGEVGGHKFFLVLADALNRRGVAVLRYDERGRGNSTGDYAKATMSDLADDAQAALRYLKSRSDVDPKRIGLIGHAEGGVIAPIVAERNRSVDFVVLLAAPAIPFGEIAPKLTEQFLKSFGVSPDRIAKAKLDEERLYAQLGAARDDEVARSLLREHYAAMVRDKLIPAPMAEMNLASAPIAWLRTLAQHNPVPALGRLKVPVLAVNGSLDFQVEAKDNLPVMRKALRRNRRATFVEMPGLNHLFQTAKTGSLMEYFQIEETINPATLQLIGEWVAQR